MSLVVRARARADTCWWLREGKSEDLGDGRKALELAADEFDTGSRGWQPRGSEPLVVVVVFSYTHRRQRDAQTKRWRFVCVHFGARSLLVGSSLRAGWR